MNRAAALHSRGGRVAFRGLPSPASATAMIIAAPRAVLAEAIQPGAATCARTSASSGGRSLAAIAPAQARRLALKTAAWIWGMITRAVPQTMVVMMGPLRTPCRSWEMAAGCRDRPPGAGTGHSRPRGAEKRLRRPGMKMA